MDLSILQYSSTYDNSLIGASTFFPHLFFENEIVVGRFTNLSVILSLPSKEITVPKESDDLNSSN
ncbi:hypothetical protein SDC9_77122 [bioreactor metagenome]|uniref:Uncharacterized protein n=1 Tax=bioreactor metagenome TaxID=1076179 RepID=A0A644YPL9_9ZZZZ